MNRNARPMTIDEIRSSEKVAQTAREAAEKQIKAMILCLSSSMDKKLLVSVLNMFVHKIKKYI